MKGLQTLYYILLKRMKGGRVPTVVLPVDTHVALRRMVYLQLDHTEKFHYESTMVARSDPKIHVRPNMIRQLDLIPLWIS